MTVSRMISGHCGVRTHLKRFSIVDESMYVCLEDHETVDHNFVSKGMPDFFFKFEGFYCLASTRRPRYETCVPNLIGRVLKSVLGFSLNVA
jgi:hypothetical protein